MQKETAKLLMECLLSFDAPLNKMTELINTLDTEEEIKEFRKAIGKIGLKIYSDLMMPIIRQHPELDPEKD